MIAFLLMIIGFQIAWINQTERIVAKLNAENTRLEAENERLAYSLQITTDELRRRRDAELRDPFRPDHPTRAESRKQ